MKKIKILCLVIFILSFFPLRLEAKVPEETLKMAKNRIASLEDRKKAVYELKSTNDPEVTKALLEIMTDPSDSPLIRRYVTESLLQTNDLWLTNEFQNILNNTSYTSEIRRLALYGLWYKRQDGFLDQVMILAQKHNEPQELRIDAINYLALFDVKEWPPNFWGNLYSSKVNPSPVCITALDTMQRLGLTSELQTALMAIIPDREEDPYLRSAAMATAGRLLDKKVLEELLIQILSDYNEIIQMKRFAVAQLSGLELDETVVDQLKKISSEEKNPTLSHDLEDIIANFQNSVSIQN